MIFSDVQHLSPGGINKIINNMVVDMIIGDSQNGLRCIIVLSDVSELHNHCRMMFTDVQLLSNINTSYY